MRPPRQRLPRRNAPPERLLVDVIGEDLLAVDLDHRDQLAVARFQLRVTFDRDLLEVEPELVTQRDDGLAGALAQVAPGGPVQPD